MSPTETITESEERLIAREIVKLLRQKGASYGQCEKILEQADDMLRKTPLIGYQA